MNEQVVDQGEVTTASLPRLHFLPFHQGRQSGSSLLGVRQQVPSSLASKRPKSHIHGGAETLSRFQARSPVVARPLKGRTTRIDALASSHKLLPPPRRAGVDHKPSATAAPPGGHLAESNLAMVTIADELCGHE